MGKLHELIAVEADLEGRSKKYKEGVLKAFRDKQALFMGSTRTCQMYNEADQMAAPPDENKFMDDTVRNQLQFLIEAEIPYLNALAQKAATNQSATADIEIDGVVLISGVPATMLLTLETKLTGIREVFAAVPTLDAGHEWVPSQDKGAGVWELAHPEVAVKTAKKFQHQILVQPTDKHPAQIEKWEEQVPVGKFVKRIWSSKMTSAEKSNMLSKVDNLIVAVKQARQRANMTSVVGLEVGKVLFNYILEDVK